MGTKVRLTDHAIERGWERMKLRRNALARQAGKAWELGIVEAETHGALMRWMEGRREQHEGRGECRIYGQFVYVFELGNPVLITVLRLPAEFRRLVGKIARS